jgi:hypothetical protein
MLPIIDNAIFFLAVVAGAMATVEAGRAHGHLAAVAVMVLMAGLCGGLMVFNRAVQYVPVGSLIPLAGAIVVYRKMQSDKFRKMAEADDEI